MTGLETTSDWHTGAAASVRGTSWARVARATGVISGAAFVVATILFLVEDVGLLGGRATYTATSAGQLHDEAVFWAAELAYRHGALWDYFLRDALYVVAWLGFVPVALALNAVATRRSPVLQVASAFLVVSAIVNLGNPIAFFVDMRYWNSTGWEQTPDAVLVAVGRLTDFGDLLSATFGLVSYAILAFALLALGRALRTDLANPGRLVSLAYAGGVALVALTVSGVLNLSTAYDALSLVTGAVLAPALLLSLGAAIARAEATTMVR